VPWITRLNTTSESLDRFYSSGKPRSQTYSEIVEEILRWVRRDLRVCAAFYGHPGVFVTPSHEAVRRARSEGFDARMFPGVSAEDCLFADLGLDPGDAGCQSYEATTFLLYHQEIDTSVPLVLWQIGTIGERSGVARPSRLGLEVLLDRLAERYGSDHKVVLYEASPYAVCEPSVERVRVTDVDPARVTGMATLYVPPKGAPRPDLRMFARLGLDPPKTAE
jgi:uroporphyrin-III C-methyltransferase